MIANEQAAFGVSCHLATLALEKRSVRAASIGEATVRIGLLARLFASLRAGRERDDGPPEPVATSREHAD